MAIVALNPLATLGTSVCSTNIHRRTTAQWSARRGSVIVGTEVPGWGCCINQEELLSPPHCAHCSYHLFPCFLGRSLMYTCSRTFRWTALLSKSLVYSFGQADCTFRACNWARKLSVLWQGPCQRRRSWDLAHSWLFPGRKKFSISVWRSTHVGQVPFAMHSLRQTCA